MGDILAVLAGSGAVWLVLGISSLLGRLRRNPVAGIRISGTMANDDAWKAGHRAAAPLMIVTGAAGLVFGVAWQGTPPPAGPRIVLYGYLAFMLVMAVAVMVVASRAATLARRTADSPVARRW